MTEIRYRWLVVPWLVPSCWTSFVILPGLIFSRLPKDRVSARHIRHEEQHLRQIKRYHIFIGLVWIYGAVRSRSIYKVHPFEVEARAYD